MTASMSNSGIGVSIRPASKADTQAIVALDAVVTGTNKSGYWADIVERFARTRDPSGRYFLVATSAAGELVGFIVGEIRDWEFGSPPCGWVLALSVAPAHRERGIGAMLLDTLCSKFRKENVTIIRTMVLWSDKVNLSFFRGEGLAAGPYIELEKSLD